ncbi:MAG TPA: T9SS type A sorting domain-containing protein [Parafilimonas sp.]|nr:T9SS type A sorting domain-containing protein [Parafilimonas sp.]
MKKNFTLLAILFLGIYAKAQEDDSLKHVTATLVPPTTGHASPNGSCDSLNIYAANGWKAYYYDNGQKGGAVFGTSNLTLPRKDKVVQDANYFDASGGDYNYISGGLVYFAFANSNIAENLSKQIVFKLYDDNNGVPGAILDTVAITLAQAHENVLQGKMTEFKFPASVALPASKKFYISVDHRHFKWNPSNHDSISIVATRDNATANSAFQLINEREAGRNWYAVNDYWTFNGDPLDVTLFIFPYVSQLVDGCDVLPVSIFNFGGMIKNSQAYLNWSTAVESNNKGFYVERSKDGKDFASIGFVNGKGNTSQITNYSYTDASLKDINVSKTYYRLKQVDIDGKSAYSNVIELSLDNLANSGKWKLYPNPVKDKATVEVNLETASKVKAQLISRDGKILSNTDKGVLNEGVQQFYINTQSIAKGSYILRITIGDKTYSQLLVKE